MYQKSNYDKKIKYIENDITEDLQNYINDYNPDFIFWSALSSHIHGEGEYVNIQYGYNLLDSIETTAKKIAGGLQVTGELQNIYNHFIKY
jgi:anaerobic magnesium-protoporphyrin IX monomethyl ester cyclase